MFQLKLRIMNKINYYYLKFTTSIELFILTLCIITVQEIITSTGQSQYGAVFKKYPEVNFIRWKQKKRNPVKMINSRRSRRRIGEVSNSSRTNLPFSLLTTLQLSNCEIFISRSANLLPSLFGPGQNPSAEGAKLILKYNIILSIWVSRGTGQEAEETNMDDDKLMKLKSSLPRSCLSSSVR